MVVLSVHPCGYGENEPRAFCHLSCMAVHFGLQKRFGCALRLCSSVCMWLVGNPLLAASQPMVLFPVKTIVLLRTIQLTNPGGFLNFVIFGLAGYSLALVHPAPCRKSSHHCRMIPSLTWEIPPYQPFNIWQMWSHLIWVKPGRCSYTEALNFFRPSFPSIPEDQNVW